MIFSGRGCITRGLHANYFSFVWHSIKHSSVLKAHLVPILEEIGPWEIGGPIKHVVHL